MMSVHPRTRNPYTRIPSPTSPAVSNSQAPAKQQPSNSQATFIFYLTRSHPAQIAAPESQTQSPVRCVMAGHTGGETSKFSSDLNKINRQLKSGKTLRGSDLSDEKRTKLEE